MEVRVFPNSTRPGIGLRPRRESQRPLLPQHARHCPVLEAGSAMGFMVFPPLEPTESYVIEFQGEGKYQFTYYLAPAPGKWEPVFAVGLSLPVGSVGMIKEDVTVIARDLKISPEEAKLFARAFFVPEDLGTPTGAVSLRGSWNFKTPEGWDTVYTSVLNNIERPIAPMLVVRVETDWYPHNSEFRYVLAPGEAISGTHELPIGQVFFVPREEVTLRDCTEQELADIREAKDEFFREKATQRVKTPYGLQYSPHYQRQSRDRKSSS
jgi:hypothetical protein